MNGLQYLCIAAIVCTLTACENMEPGTKFRVHDTTAVNVTKIEGVEFPRLEKPLQHTCLITAGGTLTFVAYASFSKIYIYDGMGADEQATVVYGKHIEERVEKAGQCPAQTLVALFSGVAQRIENLDTYHNNLNKKVEEAKDAE